MMSGGKGHDDGHSFILQVISDQRKFLLIPSALAYLYLVSSLRYKRMKDMHQRYPYRTRESFSKMTVDDAFAIYNYLIKLEFPTIFNAATSFALFKVHRHLVLGHVLYENRMLCD